MTPVLLEHKSDTEYRIYILETLLQEIECVWDTDFFNVEVLGECLHESWGYSSSIYDDYRYNTAYFEDVEQAKKFARFVQRMLLVYFNKSVSEVTAKSGLLYF